MIVCYVTVSLQSTTSVNLKILQYSGDMAKYVKTYQQIFNEYTFFHNDSFHNRFEANMNENLKTPNI